MFRSERLAWAVVAVYTAILYSTLTLAFDLYVSVYDRVGKATVSWWMNAAFVVAGVLLLAWVLRQFRPDAPGWAAILLICLVVAFCLEHLTVPAKRFHFFQYSPLTVFLFHALRFRCRDSGIFIWSMVLVSLIGLGDETIQWMLPDRHFGTLDLVINSTAGLLTLVFIGFVAKPSLQVSRNQNR